jgi:hypothetical protein
VVSASDPTDVASDNKQCTIDSCTSGVPTYTPSGAGTTCSENGGVVCNGSGTCVACTQPSHCPGADTECSTRTCVANACGVNNAPSGTALSSQTPGDCKKSVCNGSGGVTTVNDDADLPNDNKQCTNDLCSAGVPSSPPLPGGTACSETGGKVCDGGGACVECVTNADCTNGTCQSNKCAPIVCGPGTLDCDGVSGNGCECSGTLCCSSACSPPHVNGLGQTFDDCAPLGVPGNAATYSLTLALKARAAWPVSGVDGSGVCNPGNMAAVSRQTATSCAVWVYEKANAGYVRLNTASSQCFCPSTADPTWK